MRLARLGRAAGCLLFLLIAAAEADTRFWLSDAGSIPPGSAPGEVPEMNRPLGGTNHQIHVWVRPEPGATLENFSLDLISTEPDVIEFTGLEVYNLLGGSGLKRFETVFDSSEGLLPNIQQACVAASDEEGLWEFKGFSVTGDETIVGMGPGSTSNDPLYDAAQDAWLLATATFDVTALGQTELFLQIGAAGVNHFGQETDSTNVVFGGADTPLNAETQRCLPSDNLDATIRGMLAGDFDHNGLLEAADIDLLSTAARTALFDLDFDLDQDLLVDQEDRRIWIEDLFGTLFGDANLSTDVGFDDFVRLAENFGETGGWAEGDFDGDASVTFGDFVILAENFGVSAAATVPEPAGAGLAAAGLLFLLFRRQRRR